MKGLWEIPVVQRLDNNTIDTINPFTRVCRRAHRNRLNTILDQGLDEIAVVFDRVRVDQVVATTLRDDPAP